MKNCINFLLFMYLSSTIITIIVYFIFTLFRKKLDATWKYNILKINLLYYIFPAILYFLFKFTRINKNITYNINISYFTTINREINNSELLRNFLAIVWLLGSLIYITYNIYSYIKFKKIIIKYNIPILCGNIYDEYTKVFKHMKIKNKVILMKNTIIKTPMVVGHFKFMLLIPQSMENEKAIKPVIMHELTHIKRNDLLVKKIQLFIKCIFWFNPIIYMLDTLLDDWCEISCDEKVVDNLEYDERKKYGNAILNIVKDSSLNKSKFARALCSEKSYIITRLNSIMEYNSKKYKVKEKSILSLICIFALCLFISFIIERTSLFSPKYYVTNEGSIYSKEFDGGVVQFNKDTGDVKVIINKSDVDEDAYKDILNDLLIEGEIK